jgi:phage tail-like protein
MAVTGTRVDPYRNFNFLVEIDGIAQAKFSECSGLDSTVEPIEFREGGDNTTVRKLPGRATYSDITLKWGLTDSDELWQWYKLVVRGNVQRKNGSIVVYDLANATEVARWNFVSGWPTKWEGPSFNATASEVAIETLTIAHEGIDRA